MDERQPESSAVGLAGEVKILLPAGDHFGLIGCYFGDWSRLRSAQGVILAIAVGKPR